MNFVVAVFIIQWLKSNCNQNFFGSVILIVIVISLTRKYESMKFPALTLSIWWFDHFKSISNEGGQFRETGCIGGSELAIHKQIERLPALPEMVSSLHLSMDVHQGYSDTPHWVQWMPKLASFKTFPHSQFLSHEKNIPLSFVLSVFPFGPARLIKTFVLLISWFLISSLKQIN